MLFGCSSLEFPLKNNLKFASLNLQNIAKRVYSQNIDKVALHLEGIFDGNHKFYIQDYPQLSKKELKSIICFIEIIQNSNNQ